VSWEKNLREGNKYIESKRETFLPLKKKILLERLENSFFEKTKKNRYIDFLTKPFFPMLMFWRKTGNYLISFFFLALFLFIF